MKVSPNSIRPSQDFLKPNTVLYIFECLSKEELSKLPPTPIVRKNAQDQLIAIDGHNLIAVLNSLGKDVEVHIAQSDDDGIPERNEADKQRNLDLKNKFESVLEEQKRIEQEGITSFNDLNAKYAELFMQ